MDIAWFKRNVNPRDVLLIVFFSALVFGPHLYFNAVTPKGETFVGFFVNPVDTNSYKMWVTQFEHSMFAKNLYSIEKQDATYFNPLFFLQGILVGTGLEYWFVEAMFSVILFALNLVVIDRFVGLYFAGKKREAAFLFIVLFCGLEYATQSNVLLTACYTISGLRILLQTVLFYIAASDFSWKNALALLATAILLFVCHPYAVMFVPIVLVTYFACAYWMKRDNSAFLMAGAALLATFLSGLIFIFSSAGIGGVSKWAFVRFKDVSLLFEIYYYFPFSLVFLFGIWSVIKKKATEPKVVLLVIWIATVFGTLLVLPALDWMPVPLQPQKIVILLIAPLVLISMMWERLAGFVVKYKKQIVAWFLLMILLNHFGLCWGVEKFRYHYVRNDTLTVLREVAADDSVGLTLGAENISMIAPYYTKKPSLPGHWGMTANYERYLDLSDRIIEKGEAGALEEFCEKNPSAGAIAQHEDRLYMVLSEGNRPGVEVVGDALLVRCSEFTSAKEE